MRQTKPAPGWRTTKLGTYRRVSTSIWHDPHIMAVRGQSRDAFELLIYCLTCPHSNLIGLFRLPLAYASADLGWDVKRVKRALALLKKHRQLEYDRHAGIIWCPSILAWQQIQNLNQALGAVRQLTALPDTPLLEHLKTALASEFGRQGKSGETILGPIAEFFGEAAPQKEPSRNRSETVSKESAKALATVSNTEAVAVSSLQLQKQRQVAVRSSHVPPSPNGETSLSSSPEGQAKLRTKCRQFVVDGVVLTDGPVLAQLVKVGKNWGLGERDVRTIVLEEQQRGLGVQA